MSVSEIFAIPFMKIALLSSSFIGLVFSYLGVMVVLRRIIFVGIALAQLSALGVAAAIYLDKDPTLFAFVFTLGGVILFAPDYGRGQLPKEASIGIGFVSSWALSILVLSKASHGEADMLNLVRGNILGINDKDVAFLAVSLGVVALIHVLFHRQFLFCAFDPETAGTLGLKAPFWNFLFYLSLGIAVSASIRAAGVLLTFSFLLLPAATGLIINGNLRVSLVLSALSAMLGTFLGLIVSFQMDLPAGPAIVAMSLAIFLSVSVLNHPVRYPARLVSGLKTPSPADSTLMSPEPAKDR